MPPPPPPVTRAARGPRGGPAPLWGRAIGPRPRRTHLGVPARRGAGLRGKGAGPERGRVRERLGGRARPARTRTAVSGGRWGALRGGKPSLGAARVRGRCWELRRSGGAAALGSALRTPNCRELGAFLSFPFPLLFSSLLSSP